MQEKHSFFQLALPAMAEQFLQMLMGMVDGYFVAHLGLVVISGVSVANNILTIYQAIFMALGAAVSAVMARALGKKDQAALSEKLTQALYVTGLLSLVLGLLSIFGGTGILWLLGTEVAVSEVGGAFLALVGGGTIGLGLMTTLGAVLRSTGKPRAPMYVSLLANGLNAILSGASVFIFHFGVEGVAWSTVLSRLIGAFLLWKMLTIKPARFSWRLDRELLSLALPAAGERLMMRAGDVVIIALIVTLGTDVVAGNAIGEILTQFQYMPAFGMATATVILVAQLHGAGDEAGIRRLVRQSFWWSMMAMAVIASLIYLFATPLNHLYTHDATAMAASQLVMLFGIIGAPVTAGTLTYTALWQGVGNAKLPFYATTLGMWVIRIGIGYLLTVVLQVGLAGVWIATVLDNLFRWLFLAVLYRRHHRNMLQ